MSRYDRRFVEEQARKFDFQTNSFEKVIRLAEILRFLNETAELKDALALKGGTAINLTIFNIPRLSVDIDLDLTQNLSKEETKAKRERISSLIMRYMKAEGYIEKDKSKQTHILDSFVYSYTNSVGNPDNIKIEINYSLRCHVLPTQKVKVNTADILSGFEIHTLSPIEIFASKIVAFDSRAAARDLYDINNMVYYGLFDEKQLDMLRKCAVFYMAIAGDSGKELAFEKTDSITKHKVKTDLLPMIAKSERFDVEVAKERVSAFLSEFMTLNEAEQQFLREFRKGNMNLELLFSDSEIINRIKNHPMAIWRISSIRHEPVTLVNDEPTADNPETKITDEEVEEFIENADKILNPEPPKIR